MKIFHSTSFILPITSPPIPNGSISVANGIIHDIDTHDNLMKRYPGTQAEIYTTDCLIIPSFVNTHTHLEYAHVDLPPLKEGESFYDWIIALNKISRNWDKERLKENIQYSLDTLSKNGIGLIGDNGFSGLATDFLVDYPIRSIYFQEYFGLDHDINVPDKLTGLNKKVKNEHKLSELKHNMSHELGISPHSLYTANAVLWSKLIEMYPDRIFSSHIAESKDETDFFYNGKNENIGKFYKFVLPHLEYKHPYKLKSTPYKILDEEKILEKLSNRLISVHNVNITDDDIEIIRKYNVNICLCPLSNKYLNNGLPPIDKLYNAGLNITLGTDSLGSNDDLDMLAEMREISKNSTIPVSDIIKIATINGAKALGFGNITGSLEKGKSFDALELDTKTNDIINSNELYDKIIKTDKSGIKARYYMGEEVYKAD